MLQIRAWLFFVLAWLAVTSNPLAWSQRVTTAERNSIKQIKSQVDAVNKLLKAKNFSESAAAFVAARARMDILVAGARPELLKALKPEYDRLVKAHKALSSAGEELASMPSLEEAAAKEVKMISFQESVAPIIVAKCGNCHINQTRGRFSAASFDALEKSTTIAFGIPRDSRLIQVIESGEMPQGGLEVAAEELEILRNWILQGAKFDGEDRNQNLAEMVNRQAAPAPLPEPSKPTGKETISFGLQIAPILVENCGQCHMVNNPRGNFSQTTFANLLRGGNSGPPIKPKDAAASLLFSRISAGEMPPTGRLPQSSIDLIKTWIEEGAIFDGSSPTATLSAVATLAKSNAQTHAELNQNRRQRSARQWELVMDKAAVKAIESEHFRVIGSDRNSQLQAISESLEKMTPKILAQFKSKGESTFVKGNVNVFVFDKRYDFSEFGRMVGGREVAKDQIAHWDYTVTDAFTALLLSASQSTADLEPVLGQQAAAIYASSLAVDMPRWLADGLGYWSATKLFPKHEQIGVWETQSLEALQSIKSPDDLLNNRLPDVEAGLVGYQVVKAMKKRGSSFDRLIEKMRTGETFESAFSIVYGSKLPAYLSQGW